MNLATWSLRNPSAAILIFILLTVAGLWGFHKLNVQDFPDLDLPMVNVSLSQPGAAPAQLETEVARKAEDALANLQLLRHTYTTISHGNVNMTVEFDFAKDLTEAVSEVKAALDGIRSDLPPELLEPQVAKLEMGSDNPTVTYAVSSSNLSEEELSWYVDNTLAKKLKSVRGVGQFNRLGGVTREIQVQVDPIKLNALGVTATDISQTLKQIQQENSGGRSQLGGSEQGVRTIATLKTVAELEQLPISLGTNALAQQESTSRTVRLGQVAKVLDTHAEPMQSALLDGTPAIGFQVIRAKGFDETQLAADIELIINEMVAQHPEVSFQLIRSSVPKILDQYHGSMNMLYEGAILAILVIFFFLRDWRATLIGAIALPLSIIPTFAIMYWADFSINTITLLAMAVVVGVLVDDAIVEVENIARHQHMGKSVKQATVDAVNEIALAVVATTATLVVVFLPTAMMSGIPGLVFKQFGWTLVIAVLISLLVARIVTPMTAIFLLKTPTDKQKKEHDTSGRLNQLYLHMASWCLQHRKTTLAAGTVFFIVSIGLAGLLPAGFIPAADEGMTFIRLETPPGNSLHSTELKTEEARNAIRDIPGIAQIFTTVGAIAQQGEILEVRKATLMVMFTKRGTRPSQTAIETEIRTRLHNIAGIKYSAGAGGPGEKLQILLTGEDSLALATSARAIEREIRSLGYLSGVTSTASLEQQEIQVLPNIIQASERGVSTHTIGETLRIALAGDYDQTLAKLNLDQRQLDIRVMLPPELRKDANTLGNLRIHSNQGLVPLNSLATIRLSSAPSQISRLDRQQQITISADLGGHALGDALEDVKALPSMKALPGSVHLIEGGDAEIMVDLFMGFVIALLTGIFCVYAVLVLLFKDWLQPITILSAVPLSVGGAFIALLLADSELSLPAMIGLVMLLGIVTKNSILLVDFAIMALQEPHTSKHSAILDACSKRARPVLMTSVAMIAGMLPLAFGFGGDASFRQPMAIAVIGGLITSTALSLLVVPVVFSYMTGLERRLKNWAGIAAPI
ncbi:MAG TPA: efflux RND transporter permease subunit [Cellvibrio sp.]